MSLSHLHSLWVGDRLKYLERLCIASATACGHEFTLWSYDPKELEGVPSNIELRDAAEIMPRDRLLSYRGSNYVSLGANLWRYELLHKGLGCWVDMDLIFVRPFDFESEYVFGRQADGQVNNAVLFAPPSSPFVQDLVTLAKPNRRPPWFGPRKSLDYYWRCLKYGQMELGDYPWATFGPGLVNYAVKKNGLTGKILPKEVFYPIDWSEAHMLYGPAEEVEARITPHTRAIHMWHGALSEFRDAPPPKGSYMDKVCKKFNVDVN